MRNKIHIFWDLDGVITSWPEFREPAHSDVAIFHQLLAFINKKGIKNTVLTNRPSSQTFSIAHDLDARDSLFICENGGVLFEVSSQNQFLNPKYFGYVRDLRPKVVTFLESKFDLSEFEKEAIEFQYEPGGSIVRIALLPRRKSLEEAKLLLSAAVNELDFAKEVNVLSSKLIEIVPRGLDKSKGVNFLESMYKKLKREGIGWKDSLFIADSVRDIATAKVVLKKGVTIASVGNAAREFKNLVFKTGGILAPERTTYNNSVNWILRKFLSI